MINDTKPNHYDDGVHDISNDDYHASSGLSRSALWEFKKSPRHYWHRYLNPNREDSRPTSSMLLGNLVHTLTLEPDRFDEEYILPPVLAAVPVVEKLKDVGREEYDRQKLKKERVVAANDFIITSFNSGKGHRQIVPRETLEQARAMSESVLGDEVARECIKDAKIERSIYFTHESTGLQCKARPDIWRGNMVADLKTTKDASPYLFKFSANKFGYYVQAGMIHQALKSIGIDMKHFLFICVESAQPYATALYILEDDALDYGVNLFNKLMEDIKLTFEANQWESYPINYLSAPKWANEDLE